jgi:hypothetical protein
MNYIIELDDLHPDPSVDCLEIAEQLLEKYPSLILNFFVPANYEGVPLSSNREWCGRLRTLVDAGRICLGVHGLNHNTEFGNISYQEAVSSIIASESVLNSVGLSYAKVFRGPYWLICGPTIDALIDLGYTHLYSHPSYDQLNDLYKDKIKIVIYNWNLKDDWPKLENPIVTESLGICVAHGHTSRHAHLNCGNGLWDIHPKISKLIEEFNPEFLRLDQV